MYLKPEEAGNEGQRRLRELLRTKTYDEIAVELRVDESTVRGWARGKSRPSTTLRERCRVAFAWPLGVWDEAPSKAFAPDAAEPPTEPLPGRAQPSTLPRPGDPGEPGP